MVISKICVNASITLKYGSSGKVILEYEICSLLITQDSQGCSERGQKPACLGVIRCGVSLIVYHRSLKWFGVDSPRGGGSSYRGGY